MKVEDNYYKKFRIKFRILEIYQLESVEINLNKLYK